MSEKFQLSFLLSARWRAKSKKNIINRKLVCNFRRQNGPETRVKNFNNFFNFAHHKKTLMMLSFHNTDFPNFFSACFEYRVSFA